MSPSEPAALDCARGFAPPSRPGRDLGRTVERAEALVNDDEDFLEDVFEVGRAHTEPLQRCPHEPGVLSINPRDVEMGDCRRDIGRVERGRIRANVHAHNECTGVAPPFEKIDQG
jgi:hypothetical protein